MINKRVKNPSEALIRLPLRSQIMYVLPSCYINSVRAILLTGLQNDRISVLVVKLSVAGSSP